MQIQLQVSLTDKPMLTLVSAVSFSLVECVAVCLSVQARRLTSKFIKMIFKVFLIVII